MYRPEIYLGTSDVRREIKFQRKFATIILIMIIIIIIMTNSIIVPVTIEMYALRLVKDYVISR